MEAKHHTSAKPPPSRAGQTVIECPGLNSEVPEVVCRGLTLSQSAMAGQQGHDIGTITLMGLGVGSGNTARHGIAGLWTDHTLV